MHAIISIFILMMYMHILFPRDQFSRCQAYDSIDSCSAAGFDFLYLSHHPCSWIVFPDNIKDHNCVAADADTTLTAILLAAFITCVLSKITAFIIDPILKILRLYRADLLVPVSNRSLAFSSIVPAATSDRNSGNRVRKLKLMFDEEIYTQTATSSKPALDHLTKILHRVYSSQYGRVDRNLLSLNSTVSKSALLKVFTADFSDFVNHTGASSFSNELKSEWGVTSPSRSCMSLFKRNSVLPAPVAENIEAALYIPRISDIAKEMSRANTLAASMFMKTRSLEEHEKRYLLMDMFVADVIGRNTPEGKLFSSFTMPTVVIYSSISLLIYNILCLYFYIQQILPSLGQWLVVLFFCVILVVFFIVFSLFVLGKDSTVWFQSFFFLAIGFTIVFEILADFVSVSICDVLIPNMIYSAVTYTKRICEHQAQKLSSLTYPLDYFDSFSSSRYLHASHFYADCIEFSIEKVFVMSYINPFPGRAGLSWSHNEASFTTPIGRLLISICLIIPQVVLRLFTSVIASVVIVTLFICISLYAGDVIAYCLAGALVGILLLLPALCSSNRVEPRNKVDRKVSIKTSLIHPIDENFEKTTNKFVKIDVNDVSDHGHVSSNHYPLALPDSTEFDNDSASHQVPLPTHRFEDIENGFINEEFL